MNARNDSTEIDEDLAKLNQQDLDRFLNAAERSLESIGFDRIEEDTFNSIAGVFRHRGDEHPAWDDETFGNAFSDWGAAWVTIDDWSSRRLTLAGYQDRLTEVNTTIYWRAQQSADHQPAQDIFHMPVNLISIEAYLDGSSDLDVLQTFLTNVRPENQNLPFEHRWRGYTIGKDVNRSRHRNAQFKSSPLFVITQTGDYFFTPTPRLRFIPRQVYGKEIIEKTMGSIQRQYQISESFRSEARRRQR